MRRAKEKTVAYPIQRKGAAKRVEKESSTHPIIEDTGTLQRKHPQ